MINLLPRSLSNKTFFRLNNSVKFMPKNKIDLGVKLHVTTKGIRKTISKAIRAKL